MSELKTSKEVIGYYEEYKYGGYLKKAYTKVNTEDAGLFWKNYYLSPEAALHLQQNTEYAQGEVMYLIYEKQGKLS